MTNFREDHQKVCELKNYAADLYSLLHRHNIQSAPADECGVINDLAQSSVINMDVVLANVKALVGSIEFPELGENYNEEVQFNCQNESPSEFLIISRKSFAFHYLCKLIALCSNEVPQENIHKVEGGIFTALGLTDDTIRSYQQTDPEFFQAHKHLLIGEDAT